ncbi:MAG: phosphoenolpyruvate--protein phosphotransferase [Planctomycetaceae bacterium]|nr:phosphoenolpyruvate--protein phosphotransferase [Planctomycetaceae bacterium]
MLIRTGIAVSPGVAISPAMLFGSQGFRIPQRFVSVDAVDSEVSRFYASVETVSDALGENERVAREQLGDQYAAIFSAHRMMLRDPKLNSEIESLIRTKCFSPEFAASRVLRNYAKTLQNLGNAYLAERAADVFDLEKRLLKTLLGEQRPELSHLTEPVVVLAYNLTPGETANLNRDFVKGFATEAGGHTSHTAILAGALEIPAVVGIGKFLADVSAGDVVIIDGNRGEVIIDPDEATVARYQDSLKQRETESERLAALNTIEARTNDNVRIQVLGNIEFPQEVAQCAKRGADGIGLYRTEFLYLGSDHEPTEEEHYNAYCSVIREMGDHPIVIRTLDLGADKIPGDIEEFRTKSDNPALGLRSIRLSLRHLGQFKVQLRAILRAAVHGDIRIMFPLVTTLLELRRARMILADVIEDLEEEKAEFRRDIPVGMMVEVPAAALLAHNFAREVDFFSIGTNDLIQYTMAVDRAEPLVASLYRAGDPSILRLIQMVIDAGRVEGIPVTVCGQMSSDPKFIPLLLGLGIRNVSVTPSSVPEVKDVVRNFSINDAEQIAKHALSLDVARDVEHFLRNELNRLCPDRLSDAPQSQ